MREFGALDVCYANAGVSGGLVPLQEQTPEHWAEILKINLIGTFLAVKHAARVMTPRKRGSIICTASVAGLRSGAGGSPYSASKAGVVSLVQTTAYQLSGSGVRINAICPGLIETGMTRPIFEQARARGTDHKIGQLNPLRRAGAPDEIAQMALFLASDDASYVNGQAFPVDGGLSSSHPIVPPQAVRPRAETIARGTASGCRRRLDGEPRQETALMPDSRAEATPLAFRCYRNGRAAERRRADRATRVPRHRPALAPAPSRGADASARSTSRSRTLIRRATRRRALLRHPGQSPLSNADARCNVREDTDR